VQLDPDTCYRALSARDARFDGDFFVGVTTTGIYCRPICPARLPGRARCRFFRLAAEAEREGFRACFRCRPELAPGAAPIDALSRLTTVALARIEEGALDDGDLPALAAELGVSTRHVRRAFARELGVSPVELAQSRRLARAKQLLQDTAWPLTRVAFASGFSSVRRFNALFAERFGDPPSSVRRGAALGDPCPVRLGVRLPFAWDALLAFLAPRATPGVEEVAEGRYRRTVAIDPHRGWFEAGFDGGRLCLTVAPSLLPVLPAVVARARRLFDVDARPDRIARALEGDPDLRARLDRLPGVRVPGAFEPFELVVRTILGQQVSVAAATRLAGRLAADHGEPIETPWPTLSRLSPTAARLREVTPGGMPRARAEALRAVASAFASGEITLGPGRDASALGQIRGVGPWTVAYVSMRACQDPDAFPASDLGLRRALAETTERALSARAEAWRPWRAYAAMLLWMGEKG
jgi:AraC family transcriptional regulator of adaptative response / DNA-3-methyladenine glycosylase II